MVGVGFMGVLPPDKLVTWHAVHRSQHALVMNIASTKLRLDHLLAHRKIGIDLVLQRHDPRIRQLFFAAAYSNVEADYSVLVTDSDHGNIASDVVFHLDNLLRRLRHVGAVGQGQIVGNLLLDRDLRSTSRVGFSAQPLGVDLDPASTKQTLDPVADGCV